MDIEKESVIITDESKDSLSDDSNLSSVSLLKTLTEKSEGDISYCKLSLIEKISLIPNELRCPYFEKRLTTSDSYSKDVQEDMRRTERDRSTSFKDFLIPKYSSNEPTFTRKLSRPNLSELRIPLMTKFSKSITDKNKLRSSSTYVSKLLSTYDTKRSRSRRVSTVRLDQYRQKIREDEMSMKRSSLSSTEYTPEEKKIIDEVLGDIPYREESVYVPYGKVSYLQGIKDAEGEEPINIFSPSVQLELPSYDESLQVSSKHSRSFLPDEKCMKIRSSMWERTPSYEFTLDPEVNRVISKI
nr:uncharacterized protein LOC106683968 [Halyomorpha halys]XP_014281236.1 uncharacterized protein LOC106683968 [Halyomorpha halys]